ncbi:MAG TPA: 3-hydroxyacyl-CoA dehydrogenase family protein [Puia sp.]|nr:3-hydroxyacyl-CoA dehydrogenase family protein [Puia sp.]
MKIAALADTRMRKETEDKGIPSGVEWVWADSAGELARHSDAALYFDLDFKMDNDRIGQLSRLSRPVVINSVAHTLQEIGRPFIRISAWPGFLNRPCNELAVRHKEEEQHIARSFDELGWKYRFVADIPGMISARILAMIINEAYYTLQDKVSSRMEIDVAMKLGTNYPYGPFEWSEKIGIGAIDELLTILSATDSRYTVAPALKEEVERLKLS